MARSFRSYLLFFCFSLLLTSCTSRVLEVRSQFLTPLSLPSLRVGTPDPCQQCYRGQEIVVYYHIPPRPFCEAVLRFHIRYGDLTVHVFDTQLDTQKGYFTYQLLNAPFWERGGILSYKVELLVDGACVACKKHHLWADIISL